MRLSVLSRGMLLAVLCLGGAARAAETPEVGADADVTLITISEKGILPEDLFDLIGKQAGIRFAVNGSLWDQDRLQTPVNVDYKNQPFWVVVNDVCNQLNIRPSTWGWGGNGANSARRVYLENASSNRNAVERPMAQSGGCCVVATSFSRNIHVDYANPDQRQDSATVSFQVFLDPKIKVGTFYSGLKIEEAVDDAGNSLMSDARFGENTSGEKRMVQQATAYLKYPDKPGTKIAKLKGYLRVKSILATETFTVDAPLKAGETSKVIGDITFTFQSMKKSDGGNYEVKIGVSGGDPESGGNMWNAIYSNSKLLDSAGKAFGSRGGGGGGGSYSISYGKDSSENASGDPDKWTIEIPTKVRMIKIPVEFKDLPLP